VPHVTRGKLLTRMGMIAPRAGQHLVAMRESSASRHVRTTARHVRTTARQVRTAARRAGGGPA